MWVIEITVTNVNDGLAVQKAERFAGIGQYSVSSIVLSKRF
jgi:hypothetical protein